MPSVSDSVTMIEHRNASASTIALVTSMLRLSRMRIDFHAISTALESGSEICRATGVLLGGGVRHRKS
jgi:hypothetical protein